MANQSDLQSFAGRPIVMTHWDADLYPSYNALPPIQELVLHILAWGEVRVKDVDLFLNPKIKTYFSDDARRAQLSSLLHTQRLKILLPPKSTRFDVDPEVSPLTAVAMERVRSKRPLKDQPWDFTPGTAQYCQMVDSIIASSRDAITYRTEYPQENTFANKLEDVLTGQDTTWRKRPQFRGITDRVAEEFAKLSIDQGFYRSQAYEYSKVYPSPQRRSIRNLVQSVYTYCELGREGAAGTYFGSRIAEIPPTTTDLIIHEPTRVTVFPLPGAIEIPVATNIGEITKNVLDECGEEMRQFWSIGAGSNNPQSAFIDAWAHIADAFARHSIKAERTKIGQKVKHTWEMIARVVHGALLIDEVGAIMGVKFLTDIKEQPLLVVPSAIAVLGEPAVWLIRKGRAYAKRDEERDQLRHVLLDSVVLRGAQIK